MKLPPLLIPSSSLPHSPSFSTFAGVKRLLLGTTLSVLYAFLNNYYPIEFLATKGFAVSTMISHCICTLLHTSCIIRTNAHIIFWASEREQLNFSRACLEAAEYTPSLLLQQQHLYYSEAFKPPIHNRTLPIPESISTVWFVSIVCLLLKHVVYKCTLGDTNVGIYS
jgi:hypothetical protein